MASILVVDDEPAIRQMLGLTLSSEGHTFSEAADVEQASTILREALPDLILLDWMLPGLSGIEFARRLKLDTDTNSIPIIMLTAKGEEDDKIRGLDIGADDYITKPFSTRELLARVRAVIRRAGSDKSGDSDTLSLGGISLDVQTHRASVAGQSLELSPTEFKLLQYFIANPERVFSRTQLLDNVWGDQVYIEERTVDVHIRRLRKLLEPHGLDTYIQTVRTVGYRFSTQPK